MIDGQQKKTIAIFLPDLMCGGVERVMLDLAEGFKQNHYNVDLVLSKAEGPFLDFIPNGINLIDLNSSRVLYSFPYLMKYIRKEKPSVVITAKDHLNIIAIVAGFFNKQTKIIVTIHNMANSMYNLFNINTFPLKLKDKITIFLIKKLYPKASAIIAVSWAAARELSDFLKLDKDKISVIYNPLDFERITCMSNESIDHPWFAEGQPPLIISIGRLEYEKDYQTLIKAFKLVLLKMNARLIIMGSGSQREILEELINELNLNDNVILWGFEENPYKYLKKADLFVLSSKFETLPTVLIEAIFLKKRFITTNCNGGIKEIITDSNYPYIVPIEDHIKLSEAIIDYLKSNPVRYEINLNKFYKNYAVSNYLYLLNSVSKQGSI